ncbi:MAG: TonB-dependent receptor [Candidatus Omnitrophota bacterium]
MRGSNSVMYGDNATGGVINIITKRGREGYHAEYTQELGNYQYSKEYLSLDGKDDLMDYFLSYSYQNSQGYRLNNAYEANDISASFNINPDDMLDLYISTGYHRDWYGQPGAMYSGNIRDDGMGGSRFPDSKAKTEDYFFTVDPVFSGEKGEGEMIFSVPVSYRARRTNSVSVSTNTYEADHHIVSIDIRPKCEIKSSFFDEEIENKMVFGVDYLFTKDQILSGDIVLQKQQYDILKETLGVYVENNMLVNKRFLLNGGLRGEWAEYIFDQNTPAESYDTNSIREAAADIGAGYKYNERSQVYMNYARSYRYPATDEYFSSAYEYVNWLGNTQLVAAVLNGDLKQQSGNNYEIGIKDNSFDFLNLNMSYYLLDNKNEIYYDTITYRNENYHHTVHHGLELETHFFLIERIKSFFAYTFQKAFFVGGKYAGKTIPLVPEDKISAGFNIEPVDGFNANLALNYVGTRFITSDQINEVGRLKPHVTVDAGVSCEIGDVRIFGSIKNLLGEKYFSNATKDWQNNIAYYPAPDGRTVEIGISYRF